MLKLSDNTVDDAFRTLVALLGELHELIFSTRVDVIYQELLANPTRQREAVLRSNLRSVLATRPGGIGEIYFEADGMKNRKLLRSTAVLRVFARTRLRDLFYLRSK